METPAEKFNQVEQSDITLTEWAIGFNIYVEGENVGSIEGMLGKLEYLVVDLHWQDKGVARAALKEFLTICEECGIKQVTTNNAIHPAMEHILETEGFDEQADDIGWEKELL
jgi:GNAT superfamily N-acetyltransferase